MNQAEFFKEKQKIWAEQERHYGMLFDDDFRKAVEERAGATLAFGDPSEGLEDLRASIPDFVEPALILLNNRNCTSGTEKVKPNKKRRKPFARRSYLVRFVLDCWERDRRSYIPWEYVTTEWNKAHLSDQISKAVLKAEYYRAIRERSIIIQLLGRRVWSNINTFELFLSRLQKLHNINRDNLAEFYRANSHRILIATYPRDIYEKEILNETKKHKGGQS